MHFVSIEQNSQDTWLFVFKLLQVHDCIICKLLVDVQWYILLFDLTKQILKTVLCTAKD